MIRDNYHFYTKTVLFFKVCDKWKMTKFGKSKIINQCDGFIQKFIDAGEKVMKDAEGPEVVAKMIYNSASDNNYQMM